MTVSDMALFERDALEIAPLLLGAELISNSIDGISSGFITEIEAYQGKNDPASHAFRGKTIRNSPMFEKGGHIYVYISYGLHNCLNIVTGKVGDPQAILIRAIRPVKNSALMKQRRGKVSDRALTIGPGNVAQALGITLDMSGEILGQHISINLLLQPIPTEQIIIGSRIGISVGKDYHWRFRIRD